MAAASDTPVTIGVPRETAPGPVLRRSSRAGRRLCVRAAAPTSAGGRSDAAGRRRSGCAGSAKTTGSIRWSAGPGNSASSPWRPAPRRVHRRAGAARVRRSGRHADRCRPGNGPATRTPGVAAQRSRQARGRLGTGRHGCRRWHLHSRFEDIRSHRYCLRQRCCGDGNARRHPRLTGSAAPPRRPWL